MFYKNKKILLKQVEKEIKEYTDNNITVSELITILYAKITFLEDSLCKELRFTQGLLIGFLIYYFVFKK